MINIYRYEDGLKRISRPYHPERFIALADHTGWSDGFIADLTDFNTDKYLLETKIHNHAVTEKDKGPKIQPLIPGGRSLVESMEYDMVTGHLKLINHIMSAWVNPDFVQYFQTNYKKLGGIQKLVLTASDKAIKVIVGDALVGLIMPIRHAEN
jgi:hypothetical protein